MRAALLHNTGDEKLEIVDDLEVDAPGPGEVTIKIEATGVCHSDLHAMQGSLPQPAPFVPGPRGRRHHLRRGRGRHRPEAEGDHVVVAWSPPCGKCNNCVERKQPHLCVMIQFAIAGVPRFTRNGEPVFGMAGTGTFAEYLTVPAGGRHQDRRRHPVRDRLAHRLRRLHRRGRGDQHRQGPARLQGRGVRLRRRRHRRHPGRPRGRGVGHRRGRPQRGQARAGQDLRRHPRL
jgi:hypothetical protein